MDNFTIGSSSTAVAGIYKGTGRSKIDKYAAYKITVTSSTTGEARETQKRIKPTVKDNNT